MLGVHREESISSGVSGNRLEAPKQDLVSIRIHEPSFGPLFAV
jgi:hypothetical protein